MDEKTRRMIKHKFDLPTPLDLTKEDFITIVDAFSVKRSKGNMNVILAAVELYFNGCSTDKLRNK
ncbi:hypothetical protein [Paenibacillus terrigena]|uniref:hypothetical protein n=1 Tax=Paenibacillus terrigena TaxID=369333 RepID=UPI0003A958C4|nr:hypothetical protein [Paenibacillus terrigena]